MKPRYEKEKLLIEYLISSTDIYGLCIGMVKCDYFIPDFKSTIEFIQKYYEKYKNIPDSAQILAEVGINLTKQQMTTDKIAFATDELEKFCRQRALEIAVVESADFLESGNVEKYGLIEKMIKDALTVSLNRDLGIDFLNDNVIARLDARKINEAKLPSGLLEFDDKLNGGPDRKSIVIFCSGSGGGKSVTLQNFALKYTLRGLNVLYISLELYQTMIDDRIMMMISDIPSTIQIMKKQEVSNMIYNLKNSTSGNLLIKYIPTGSKINIIRSYLKELELMKGGFKPDVLVVDYLDLLTPNMAVSAENVFLKDKYSTEELRALGIEYNMLILTASQLNREARKESDNLGQHHIAGGISKVNTADVVLAVDCDSNSKECHMKFLKTRSSGGVGSSIVLSYNPSNLIIDNLQDGGKLKKGFEFKSAIKKYEAKNENVNEKSDFLNLIGEMPQDYS